MRFVSFLLPYNRTEFFFFFWRPSKSTIKENLNLFNDSIISSSKRSALCSIGHIQSTFHARPELVRTWSRSYNRRAHIVAYIDAPGLKSIRIHIFGLAAVSKMVLILYISDESAMSNAVQGGLSLPRRSKILWPRQLKCLKLPPQLNPGGAVHNSVFLFEYLHSSSCTDFSFSIMLTL